MPVICLENYLGTEVVNRALCWIVNVVLEKLDQIPAAVLVVAAKSQEEAMAKVEENELQELLADKVMVPLVPVKKQG
jgi:hypothetical protein